MNKEIFEKVRALLAEHNHININKLSEQAELLKLGIDGDEAAEFMEVFRDTFSVDMSEFEFDKHFGPEAAFNPIVYIFWLLFDRDKLKSIPITLRDLTEAAEKKKWVKRGAY